MLKYITGAIIAIILFAGGVLLGKHYFSSTEIKVVEKKVYETVWKTKVKYVKAETKDDLVLEDCNNLIDWYNSPLEFKDHTENNYLYVTAFDLAKSAEVRYKIGTKGNWILYGSIALAGIATGVLITQLR